MFIYYNIPDYIDAQPGLTRGQVYNVCKQKFDEYLIIDDNGKKKWVCSRYFEPGKEELDEFIKGKTEFNLKDMEYIRRISTKQEMAKLNLMKEAFPNVVIVDISKDNWEADMLNQLAKLKENK